MAEKPPKKPTRTVIALDALHQAAIALAAAEADHSGYRQLAKEARRVVNDAIVAISARPKKKK